MAYFHITATNAEGLPASTRWEGTRCIDYFITSGAPLIKQVELVEEAIADHKIMSACITLQCCQGGPDRPYRLLKTSKLQKPDAAPTSQWRAYCDDFACVQTPPAVPAQVDQSVVDLLWADISHYYEQMLEYALHCSQNGQAARQRNALPRKGQVKIKNHLPQSGQLDRANDSYRIRKLRNLIAKAREVQKLRKARRTDCAEYRHLICKLRQSHHYRSHLDWADQIKYAEKELAQARLNQRDSRIQDWKHRMQTSVSACYKWIKHASFMPSCGLISSALQLDEATRTTTEALELIRDHWRLVWRRPEADPAPAYAAINAEVRQQRLPPRGQEWQPLTADALAKRAAKLKAKAAGADGWSGSEIATIPAGHFGLFAEFCQACEQHGFIPQQRGLAIQAHLPKSQKGVVHMMAPVTPMASGHSLSTQGGTASGRRFASNPPAPSSGLTHGGTPLRWGARRVRRYITPWFH